MGGHLTGPDRIEPFSTEPSPRGDLGICRLERHAGARRTFPRADDLSAQDILGFLDEQIRAVERELATALRRS